MVDLAATPAPALVTLGVDGSDGWLVKGTAARSGDIVYLSLRVKFGESLSDPGIVCLDPTELDAAFRPRPPAGDVITGGGENFPAGVGYIHDENRASPYDDPDQPTAHPLFGAWVDSSPLGIASPLLAFSVTAPFNPANGQNFIGQPDQPWTTPIAAGTLLFVTVTYLWSGETE